MQQEVSVLLCADKTSCIASAQFSIICAILHENYNLTKNWSKEVCKKAQQTAKKLLEFFFDKHDNNVLQHITHAFESIAENGNYNICSYKSKILQTYEKKNISINLVNVDDKSTSINITGYKNTINLIYTGRKYGFIIDLNDDKMEAAAKNLNMIYEEMFMPLIESSKSKTSIKEQKLSIFKKDDSPKSLKKDDSYKSSKKKSLKDNDDDEDYIKVDKGLFLDLVKCLTKILINLNSEQKSEVKKYVNKLAQEFQ